MKSIRRQIKENIITMLSDIYVDSKKVNVFLDDPFSVTSDELPAIFIKTNTEDINVETVSYPKNQRRSLSLSITCIISSESNLDEKIDELTTKVEALFSNTKRSVLINTEGNVILDSNIVSIDFEEFSDGEQEVLGSIISLNVEYICEENNLYEII